MVATAIVCGSLVVLGVAALVAYMTARGIDTGPVVQLATSAAGGLVSLGTLTLQLVGRRTQTRTDRNTGLLASAVAGQLDEDGRPTGPPIAKVSRANKRRGELDQVDDAGAVPGEQTTWLPPVPPVARRPRHRMPASMEAGYGSGPDAAGEAENRAR